MAIAYFSTWTTYGSWLPGDERGWFKAGSGFRSPDPIRVWAAAIRMTDESVILKPEQRQIVEQVIADHCGIRGWQLHAVSCRTNHVHVVLTATNRAIQMPREQFKAWTTRRLKESQPARAHWWTERGWDLYIDNETSLQEAVAYVLERQTR